MLAEVPTRVMATELQLPLSPIHLADVLAIRLRDGHRVAGSPQFQPMRARGARPRTPNDGRHGPWMAGSRFRPGVSLMKSSNGTDGGSRGVLLVAACLGIAGGIFGALLILELHGMTRPTPLAFAAGTSTSVPSVNPIAATLAPRQSTVAFGGSSSARKAADKPDEAFTEFRAALAAHSAEPNDPAWANSTQKLFMQDFAELAQRGPIELSKVDCRSKTCVARFRWHNFADSIPYARKLTMAGYRANCARRILLPEPSDPKMPYEADLYLNCDTWKQDGSRPLVGGPPLEPPDPAPKAASPH